MSIIGVESGRAVSRCDGTKDAPNVFDFAAFCSPTDRPKRLYDYATSECRRTPLRLAKCYRKARFANVSDQIGFATTNRVLRFDPSIKFTLAL